MGFYGTLVIARCDTLLPQLPEVQSAFGTRVVWPYRRDDGWQLLHLAPPFGHQWPTVGAGPAPLAEATGAPALAVWISESSCLQYAAATPDGRSWTAHFADEANADVEELLASGVQLPEGRCGYD
ncbi:hypothetical protein [Dactylosporangium sp. NPDC005555]|uniref:hypothetical protein n=1 Tax=Dactylosporangium sp. NPDC005555 TaxID=3154889 RepID=UPI0033AA97C9